MEGEDMINLPASSDLESGSESGEFRNVDFGPCEADSLPCNSEARDDGIRGESKQFNEDEAGNGQSHSLETEPDSTFVDDSSINKVSVKVIETVAVVDKVGSFTSGAHSEAITIEDKVDGFSSGVHSEAITVEENLGGFNRGRHAQNGCLDIKSGVPIQEHMIDAISDIKRGCMTFDDRQPSIRVMYNSLTRASKRKLEELLQQWSEWQAEQVSASVDQNEVVESGEETYFPALRVGTGKSSAVSFWIDSQTRNQQDKGFIALDGNAVPLYDRGYALGLTSADGSSNMDGGLEIVEDASRCFNCGSYTHSLKQCPKPRDNAAVSNARKQHKSKRNQNSASRNSIRYYQSSQGGKYDDLKPGILSAETRQLLNLGEFDPPPWLNRMREIGYPPGYLVPEDDEDQPSGIIIYTDELTNDKDQEDGEIFEMERPKKRQKMTIEFPGVNAPIPLEADARRWAPTSPNSDPSRSRSHRRSNQSSEYGSRGHHHEQQRWLGNFEDDGPPGVDPGFSSYMSYPPRYGGNDSFHSYYSPRDHVSRPRSPPMFGRPRSPLAYEDYASRGYHSSSSPYSSSDRHTSPRDYFSGRYENDIRRKDDYHSDHSYRSSHERDRNSSRW